MLPSQQAALPVLPVRPSVRPSVCPVRAPNSQTKNGRTTKIGVNVPSGRSNRRASCELKRVKGQAQCVVSEYSPRCFVTSVNCASLNTTLRSTGHTESHIYGGMNYRPVTDRMEYGMSLYRHCFCIYRGHASDK